MDAKLILFTLALIIYQSAAKSGKRGIAYDLAQEGDIQAVSSGVSWWYNWSPQPNGNIPGDWNSRYGMNFVPMLWNDRYDAGAVKNWLAAHPDVQHILVLNEPNLVEQANMSPQQAAAAWTGYESLASAANVKIVGPAITWGTMPGYSDPITWLDDFYAAYRSANGGRDPRIDALAFHWYDYGLADQLDRLKKYNKPFWVTEFANWHTGDGSAQIDTVEKQQAQMAEMVGVCESRGDVERYSWFTGRWDNDWHYTSIFENGAGQLSALGRSYVSM